MPSAPSTSLSSVGQRLAAGAESGPAASRNSGASSSFTQLALGLVEEGDALGDDPPRPGRPRRRDRFRVPSIRTRLVAAR